MCSRIGKLCKLVKVVLRRYIILKQLINAKTAPAEIFPFFTLKVCKILSKINRYISHGHFEVYKRSVGQKLTVLQIYQNISNSSLKDGGQSFDHFLPPSLVKNITISEALLSTIGLAWKNTFWCLCKGLTNGGTITCLNRKFPRALFRP